MFFPPLSPEERCVACWRVLGYSVRSPSPSPSPSPTPNHGKGETLRSWGRRESRAKHPEAEAEDCCCVVLQQILKEARYIEARCNVRYPSAEVVFAISSNSSTSRRLPTDLRGNLAAMNETERSWFGRWRLVRFGLWRQSNNSGYYIESQKGKENVWVLPLQFLIMLF